MFRKPLFWLVFVAVAVGCTLFAARFFSRAFPIVTLDLRMNRGEALAAAGALESRSRFSPPGYRQAASFSGDQRAQNFVELEGGGSASFRAMMSSGLYHPYTWKVRHFKAGETRETLYRFRPDGKPYGFRVLLPEKEPGASLDEAQARRIAEDSAAREWAVDLSPYRILEISKEVRPGGRVDHTLVYERSGAQVGEGRYRLRLVVGGDRLCELTHFLKVPEAFSRRYENLRSANDVIGTAGSVALVILYFAGGCGLGIFFLMRQHWVVWRAPLAWGFSIASLQLLAGINEWPLSWIGYDTAISPQTFALQRMMQLVLLFFLYAILFTVSFVAAESLSRRAFPHHIQQWKLWSAGVANSAAVTGRTTAGYLLVPVFLAFEVLLYFITTRWLGWWTPSDLLVQPDVLAAYLPWLSPIAVSAQAGFWEESLFRAVPIAGAALLGKRFGRRGLWIAGAMILQALVFGAGHAGYANQPSYARLVELILPSLMFGGLYLYFGLLPAIVLHFTYDVVWTALPLFVSSAPGIWSNRILVIVLALVPLWLILAARLRSGCWRDLPESVRNSAWHPPEAASRPEVEAPAAPASMTSWARRCLPVAGVLGLVAWLATADFKAEAPALAIGREEAEIAALRALEERGTHLARPWQALAVLEAEPGQQDRFVWQIAGREVYAKLMGNYLAPPHWRVRFVRFEGDVAERAEEYQVFLSGSGRVSRIRHLLPEARAGQTISENDARSMAHALLQREFHLAPAAVREVSASPSRLKERTDWLFTFAEQGGVQMPQGEKRTAIQIAGDGIADAYQFIHVPEEWARQEKEKLAVSNLMHVACLVVIGIAAAAALVASLVSWSRRRFAVRAFVTVAAALFGLRMLVFANGMPNFIARFSTAQPYTVQLFIILAAGLLGSLVLAAAVALMAGISRQWCPSTALQSLKPDWMPGLSLGLFAAGASALAASLRPSLRPLWPDYSYVPAWMPILQGIAVPAGDYLAGATMALLLFAAVDRFTACGTRRGIALMPVLFLSGFAVAGAGEVETIAFWAISGLATGILLVAGYWLVLRFSLTAVLVAAGAVEILGLARQGLMGAYPDAAFLSLAGAVAVALSVVWLRRALFRT